MISVPYDDRTKRRCLIQDIEELGVLSHFADKQQLISFP
jgi:hypothetical protein